MIVPKRKIGKNKNWTNNNLETDKCERKPMKKDISERGKLKKEQYVKDMSGKGTTGKNNSEH